jgi:glycosyltransferase involved in cell wall biosynthesis
MPRCPSPHNVMIVMPLATQKGGGELMLLDLMKQGQGLGISWHVVFLEPGPMVEDIQELGVLTEVLPAGRLRQPHRILGTILKLRRLIQRWNIDLVFGWMGKPHLYGGTAALLTSKPAMWYQLGTPSRTSVLDWLIHLLPARAIISCGEEGMKVQGSFWPHRPMRLVFPGVDFDRFNAASLPSPSEARKQLGLPLTGPIVGIVGRLQRWKGIHVFIEAIPAVLKGVPDANFVVVGGVHDLEADYAANLREQIRMLGLEGRVVLTGLQQNVPLWMQAMDVVVHASDREPFGIVVLEAMALKKPVVAGSEGGPKTIITPEVNGLLAPYGDSAALAKKILRYLGNHEFADKVGSLAQQRAAEFSTQHYAKNLVDAIMGLAGWKPQ